VAYAPLSDWGQGTCSNGVSGSYINAVFEHEQLLIGQAHYQPRLTTAPRLVAGVCVAGLSVKQRYEDWKPMAMIE